MRNGIQTHVPVALPPERYPVHIVQRAGWNTRQVVWGIEKRKARAPTIHRKPTFQPVSSRYIDYAIPAPIRLQFRPGNVVTRLTSPHIPQTAYKNSELEIFNRLLPLTSWTERCSVREEPSRNRYMVIYIYCRIYLIYYFPWNLYSIYFFYKLTFFTWCLKGMSLNKSKVKWSGYRPGVAQRVGRVIALLFHDRGTRRGWVVSSRPRPHFTPGKDPLPIVQKAGWLLGPVWTGA